MPFAPKISNFDFTVFLYANLPFFLKNNGSSIFPRKFLIYFTPIACIVTKKPYFEQMSPCEGSTPTPKGREILRHPYARLTHQ